MDGSNRIEQFPMYMSLQYVGARADLQGTEHLNIACVRRKYDDAGIREFSTNSDDRLDRSSGASEYPFNMTVHYLGEVGIRFTQVDPTGCGLAWALTGVGWTI